MQQFPQISLSIIVQFAEFILNLLAAAWKPIFIDEAAKRANYKFLAGKGDNFKHSQFPLKDGESGNLKYRLGRLP